MNVSERVAAGVKWLDKKQPGWFERIDLDVLAMDECGQCVLGQIFGDYMAAPVITEQAVPAERPAELGFDRYGNEPAEVYDELAEEWRCVIADRRGEAA